MRGAGLGKWKRLSWLCARPKDQAFGADGLRVLELLNILVVSLAELRGSKKEKKKNRRIHLYE